MGQISIRFFSISSYKSANNNKSGPLQHNGNPPQEPCKLLRLLFDGKGGNCCPGSSSLVVPFREKRQSICLVDSIMPKTGTITQSAKRAAWVVNPVDYLKVVEI